MNNIQITVEVSEKELKMFGLLCFMNSNNVNIPEIKNVSKRIYEQCKKLGNPVTVTFFQENESAILAVMPDFMKNISGQVSDAVENFIKIKDGMDSAGDQGKDIIDNS